MSLPASLSLSLFHAFCLDLFIRSSLPASLRMCPARGVFLRAHQDITREDERWRLLLVTSDSRALDEQKPSAVVAVVVA